MWNQVYNPLGNAALSTLAAAVPVVTLLVLIASGKVKAHIAAVIAVILTNLIAIVVFTMPPGMSIRASLLGIVSGFFPIDVFRDQTEAENWLKLADGPPEAV